MVLNIRMKHDDTHPPGKPINDRQPSFIHLPYTVDINMAQVSYSDSRMYETVQGKWCDEECSGAWDWDFHLTSFSSEPQDNRLLVRFYFEFENDALLFKLRWF